MGHNPTPAQTLPEDVRVGPGSDGKPRLVPHRPRLEMRGVSRSYGARTVLTSVDLEVEPGESVLITGPNGAGKTTLLRIAAGVITPHSGTLRLDGLDPDADRRAYQRQIGLLSPGDRAIYARLQVRQNLDFWARMAMIPRRERGPAIDRALERFGLQELADRRSDRLSMGQRQRVRLALTFLHDPLLALLDEPVTSLDQDGLDLLSRTFEEQASRGGSVLWCAPTGDHHSLPTDRTFAVVDGHLEAA